MDVGEIGWYTKTPKQRANGMFNSWGIHVSIGGLWNRWVCGLLYTDPEYQWFPAWIKHILSSTDIRPVLSDLTCGENWRIYPMLCGLKLQVIACRRCSNYISINTCLQWIRQKTTTRRERKTLMSWDMALLILEVSRYISWQQLSHMGWLLCVIWKKIPC